MGRCGETWGDVGRRGEMWEVWLQGGPGLELVDLGVLHGQILLRVPVRRAEGAQAAEASEARARAAGRVHGRVDLVGEPG